jgi:regulator of replication initiation timing
LLNDNGNSLLQLKNAIEEQENLKKRLAKVEEERNLMNMENVRLKMKVSNYKMYKFSESTQY